MAVLTDGGDTWRWSGVSVEPLSDEELCARIRAHDRAGVAVVLQDHHGIADLLACAAAASGEPAGSVPRAWELLIDDVYGGRVRSGLRAALLERVLVVLRDDAILDVDEPVQGPELELFLPYGDRWAGWWADPRTPWPDDHLSPETVLRALHRLPIELRVLLVLRDAAKVSEADVAALIGIMADRQSAMLDRARVAFVAAVEGQVSK